jgi:8-oxo-dGTP pyrophosphatase MutT (NUDIX family)
MNHFICIMIPRIALRATHKYTINSSLRRLLIPFNFSQANNMSSSATEKASPRRKRFVVSSFLATGTLNTASFRVSVFHRSSAVNTYPNLWAACSGSIETDDASPLAAAQRELHEETTLAPPDIELLKAGKSFELVDDKYNTLWTIYPFVWRIVARKGETDEELQKKVTIDWEHTEYKFVRPEEVENLDTVDNLGTSLRLVLEDLK